MMIKKGESGLTLVEVLIASTILVVVLAPMAGLFTSALINYQNAGEKSQLTAAGRAILEEMIAEGKYPLGSEKGKEYTGLNGIRYDVNVFRYNGSMTLRKIVVRVYYDASPENHIDLTTVRRVMPDA